MPSFATCPLSPSPSPAHFCILAFFAFKPTPKFSRHPDGVIDQEEATLKRMEGPNGEMYSFCRDPALWVGSPQFCSVYWNFQARFVSAGFSNVGGMTIHPFVTFRVDTFFTGLRNSRIEPSRCVVLRSHFLWRNET